MFKIIGFLFSLINGQGLTPIFIDGQSYDNVNLELSAGTIRGRRLNDYPVDIYRAVPYASTTRRFEMAEMIEQFPGRNTFDARDKGPTCLRYPLPGEELGEMSEDCLTLDIYIPQNEETDRGILVWIHGGGYVSGDSSYYSGIEQAVRYGNIVISIQYRLGVIGFLHHFENETVGGNYGLGDAALALRFVAENAALMGGDADKIVINGESAGSGVVMALLLHKPSTDIISGAIAQSGGTLLNFLGSMSTQPNQPINKEGINEEINEMCFRLSNCDNSTSVLNQLEQLKSVDGGELFDIGQEKGLLWAPVPKDGIFWTENALEKYMNNELNTGFKLFTGFNSYEGSIAEGFFIDSPLNNQQIYGK